MSACDLLALYAPVRQDGPVEMSFCLMRPVPVL